tara:strand:- start:26776 stop:27051 length:276 start_codon:yes stop_codon:yes gene_type:complete
MGGSTEHFDREEILSGSRPAFDHVDEYLSDATKRRRSRLCPVIKESSRVLNEYKPKTVEHAVNLLINNLCQMPEAAATVILLKRLKRIGDE